MSLVEALHNEHKARLARIARAAISPPRAPPPRLTATPIPAPAPKPEKPTIKIDPILGRIPSIIEIQRAICEHYGITRIDLLAHRRPKYLVRARQVACYLCHEMTPKSLPEIGRHMGGRDHTTIFYSVQNVEARRQTDEHLQASVEMLFHLLGGSKSNRQQRFMLSEQDVRDIRASEKTDIELGLQYGISRCTAYQVRTGKTWRHVK